MTVVIFFITAVASLISFVSIIIPYTIFMPAIFFLWCMWGTFTKDTFYPMHAAGHGSALETVIYFVLAMGFALLGAAIVT